MLQINELQLSTVYVHQNKIALTKIKLLLQQCGNIAATHFCYQKPDFETSEMLLLAATTSGNILAILLECCR